MKYENFEKATDLVEKIKKLKSDVAILKGYNIVVKICVFGDVKSTIGCDKDSEHPDVYQGRIFIDSLVEKKEKLIKDSLEQLSYL